MALSARANYVEGPDGKTVSIPVEAGTVIYDGALVGIEIGGSTDGRAQIWADATTATTIMFLGIARVTDQIGTPYGSTDGTDSVTGTTAGDIEVRVDISGVALKGIAVLNTTALTHVGNLVYATDDNTFDVTAPGGSTPIGWVIRWIVSTTCDVQLFSAGEARAFEGR